MSFSIEVRGRSPEAIKAEFEKNLSAVIAGQPVHAADQSAVLGAVELYLAAMGEAKPGYAFAGAVAGSVVVVGEEGEQSIQQISLSISLHQVVATADEMLAEEPEAEKPAEEPQPE